MRIFSPLYRRAMVWSRHRHAPWYLGTMSFAESSFFPIPPDVMLAPMSLANPAQAWRLALLQESRYWPAYQMAVEWFGRWGFWAVFIAGFSPIPYKMFTIAAGALSMALLPFTLASIIGRGMRFFLVAGLLAWGGARMEEKLHRYIDRLGWASVAVFVLGFAIYRGLGTQ
jgi:membrane protein YqaA with SNARE-associated domain